MEALYGKKVAIITDQGFEEIELTSPKKALEDAGATVHIISNKSGLVKAWNKDNWSIEVPVDFTLLEADSEEYDALIIPGGVINPDLMRNNREYVEFVQEFFEQGKPIAAICHGPQLLIETDMLYGKEMTSFPSIKTDLMNAGATWQNKEVVIDNGLITSRSPQDLEAFNMALIEAIQEGTYANTNSFTHD